jgi:hypothetical protein
VSTVTPLIGTAYPGYAELMTNPVRRLLEPLIGTKITAKINRNIAPNSKTASLKRFKTTHLTNFR